MWTSFWILLGALAVYGVVHSLAASHRVKAAARRLFGPATDRWYRLAFSLFGGLSFLPVLFLFAWLPDQLLYMVPYPYSLLMLAVQALGGLFFLWALAVIDLGTFLGLRQLAGGRDEAVERLTTSGPYRLVRHPLYTASLLVLWFMPVMSVNLLAFNLGVTAYFVIGSYFEEQKLLQQFGQAYEAYRVKTPMLIPVRLIRPGGD